MPEVTTGGIISEHATFVPTMSETKMMLFNSKFKMQVARDMNNLHYIKYMQSCEIDTVCNVAHGWLSNCLSFVTDSIRY